MFVRREILATLERKKTTAKLPAACHQITDECVRHGLSKAGGFDDSQVTYDRAVAVVVMFIGVGH